MPTNSILTAFHDYSLAMSMIKNVDTDTIVYANEAFAKSMGLKASDLVNVPSEKYYPDTANIFHEEDLKISASQRPRLNYLENFTDIHGQPHQLITNKWPFQLNGINYVGISAIDITDLMETVDNANDHGGTFNGSVLKEAQNKHRKMFEQAYG